MYEAFYGFKRRPFSLNPDPDFLYLSEKHRTALSLLEYSLLNQAAFSVITGEIGTGKTTLIRYLLHHMEANFSVGLITNTHQNFGELLQWTLMAFGLEYREKGKVELYKVLYDYLIQEYAQNRQTLLIIDEAQNLGSDALEELRMLSNINTDDNQLLQMILVGQPGLRDLLKRSELEQFAQRIAVDYHLKSLSQKETYEYIYHRIAVAGGQPLELFDREACEAIFLYSQGTPRLINLLLDTALVYGFAEEARQIKEELIHQVVQDKQQGGIFPLRAQAVDVQKAEASGELDDNVPWPPEYVSIQEEIIETMLDQIGHSIVEDEKIEELPVSWKDDEAGMMPRKGGRQQEKPAASLSRGEQGKPHSPSNAVVPKKERKSTILKTIFVTAVAGLSIVGIFFFKDAYNLVLTSTMEGKSKAPGVTLSAAGGGNEKSVPVGESVVSEKHMDAELTSDKPAVEPSLEVGSVFYPATTLLDDEHLDEPHYSLLGKESASGTQGIQHALTAASQFTSENTRRALYSETSSVEQVQRVTVQKGDTLAKIIITVYGQFNEELLDAVLQFNPHLSDPNLLLVGQIIKLPIVTVRKVY